MKRFRITKLSLLAAALSWASAGSASAQGADPAWDLWEWMDFYQLTGNNDPFEDTDGDGVVDWVEFGFGMNPLVPDPAARTAVSPEIRRLKGGTMELVIQQPAFPAFGDWYGRNWFWISVQRSTDLHTWEEIALKPGLNDGFYPTLEGIQISAQAVEGDRYRITIRDLLPVQGGPRMFYRLEFFLVS